jgi:hypothetical protein
MFKIIWLTKPNTHDGNADDTMFMVFEPEDDERTNLVSLVHLINIHMRQN